MYVDFFFIALIWGWRIGLVQEIFDKCVLDQCPAYLVGYAGTGKSALINSMLATSSGDLKVGGEEQASQKEVMLVVKVVMIVPQ